jgi:hypothetical protein
MLKELASVSIGMLAFHGHVTDAKVLRRSASQPRAATPPTAQGQPRARKPAAPVRDSNGLLETVALAMTAGGSLLCVAFGALALIGGQPL